MGKREEIKEGNGVKQNEEKGCKAEAHLPAQRGEGQDEMVVVRVCGGKK